MTIGQIENKRCKPQGNKSASRRPIPEPSRCADDYAIEMRAQGIRAAAKMAKLLAGELADDPAPKPEPAPKLKPASIPTVPTLEDIARSQAERDAEFDALIARLEEMSVDNDPSKAHRIAHAVAKAYGLTFQQLKSPSRFKHIVRARHHAMWAMRQYTKLSMPLIGKMLGDRDHTTVLHGTRMHQKRIDAGEVSGS